MKSEGMFKVKVLRSETRYGHDSYDDISLLHPVSTDWEEVTAERRAEIQQAIAYANSSNKNNGYYFMVEYSDNTMADLFASASAFMEKIRKDQERAEAARLAEKAKRDAKSLERKRKQLEKLQRELAETELTEK